MKARGAVIRRRGARLGLLLPTAALLAGAAYGAWEFRALRKRGAVKPPPTGTAVPADPADASKARALAGSRKAFVVWTSNRAGTHDLWHMNLATGEARPLTSDGFTDAFPRISPEGTRVVFSRSRSPWVSQRNHSAWDTWLLDLESGKEQRVAEYATAASWVDPDRIVFQRNATQAVLRVLSSGREHLILQSGQASIPDRTILETPSYHPIRRELVCTLRGSTRMVARVRDEHPFTRLSGGCQHHWTAGGQAILGVEGEGRMKNAIYRYDADRGTRTRLFDAESDWSHEYFPRLSPDGAWLIYAASQGGHEHDTADYETFLWPVGQPADRAIRLTWHTGNDAWPDVWAAPQ